MRELIVPGTYITERAEGLISGGRISTGVVGVVGTAASGPVGKAVTLASFADAREVFGLPDDFQRPEDGSNPLTLTRSLSLIFNNGASGVIAVRTAGSSQARATFALNDAQGRTVARLTAATPGTWANDIAVSVEDSEEDCLISGESVGAPFDRLRYGQVVPSAQNAVRVVRGATRQAVNFALVYKRVVSNVAVLPNAGGRFFLPEVPVENLAAINEVRVLAADGSQVRRYGDGAILYGAGAPPAAGEIRVLTDTGEIQFEAGQVPTAVQRVAATYGVGHAAPGAGQVLITAWDGSLAFAAGQAPIAANGDTLTATYVVSRAACVRVSLEAPDQVPERFVTPDGRFLATRMGQSSRLATVVADATNGQRKPAPADSYFGTGSNTAGNNGAAATADDYSNSLETLAEMTVNIVVLAGQNATDLGEVLLGHLNSTAESDHERMAVIGAKGTTVQDFLGHQMAHERLVLVAPGLRLANGVTLPPAYAAAAVAGLISSLPVQGSLTNKALAIGGLATNFNRGQQEQLIQRNVLTVIEREGFRVLKGMTTSGQGTPYSAIPTRRIVDFAKYGVRSASNPYIGRLNNERVRTAMKATLDAFLTRMVEDEALTGYELEVSATRAQEIAGEVNVVMTLQPTFSIEYIRVTMILK